MTPSEVFSTYNRIRAKMRRAQIDTARLNRALGIVQTKAYEWKYVTTQQSCDCADMTYRRPVAGCKHVLAEQLIAAVEAARTQHAALEVEFVEAMRQPVDA